MKRRQFILAVSSMLALPAFAQNKGESAQGLEPYKEINPPIAAERNKVHAVIAFTCPVCAHYHGLLSGWGDSLPKQFSFDFVPAITDKDSTTTAIAWLAMKKVAPEKLGLFASSLYKAIQEKGLSVSAPDGSLWKSVLREVGPTPGFGAALKAVRQEDLAVITKQISSFQLSVTPSVVVCGKYIVTPDNANGDEGLFTQLASGMVSKFM